MKSFDSIGRLPFKLLNLKQEGGNGILGVRVKSVDIEKNTGGEGDFLVLS